MDDRRGDWEKAVDVTLLTLTQCQRSTDQELDDLDLKTQSHDRIILGDAENGKIGMSAQLDANETLLNATRSELRNLQAVVFGDHTGHPGLDQRVTELEDKKKSKESRAEKREGYFWHLVTAIVLQLFMLAGTAMLNWDRIEDFAKKHWHRGPAVKAQVAKPKRPRKPKPIVVPEAPHDAASQDVP